MKKFKIFKINPLRRESFFKKTSLYKAFAVLKKSEKKKLLALTTIQVSLGFLDLIGIIALGAIGALTVQGIQGEPPGTRVNFVFNLLNLQSLSPQSQVAFLGISAAFVLILKTIVSMIFTRRTYFLLSRIGADFSADLAARLLAQNLLVVQRRSSQETLFIISDGVKNLMVGILATGLTLFSDISLLLILLAGLFFIDSIMAFGIVIIFTLVGIILYKSLQLRALEVGVAATELVIENNLKLLEVLNSFRESVVRNRRAFYVDQVRVLKFRLGNVVAELNFQPYISKYVFESFSVLIALILAVFAFATKNAASAVAVLTVFIAATSRILPAALRIQQSILTIRSSAGTASSTLDLIDELRGKANNLKCSTNPDFVYKDFEARVTLEDVSFSYSRDKKFEISGLNLKITQGQNVAIVGSSGAGKSTLVDLILGVYEPDIGSISISNLKSLDASAKWGGAISYVPQSVNIALGTVRENVALGYPIDIATDEKVWEALKIARLEETIDALPDKLDTNIGESGLKLSGGQRQRLGIARALFTKPKLLVLDEATSSLDGVTEKEINDSLTELSSETTVIIVAHRLSTVQNADIVVYMEKGRIVCTGNFEEVRKKVPNFDKQVKLLAI